jgi:hypothetical protein
MIVVYDKNRYLESEPASVIPDHLRYSVCHELLGEISATDEAKSPARKPSGPRISPAIFSRWWHIEMVPSNKKDGGNSRDMKICDRLPLVKNREGLSTIILSVATHTLLLLLSSSYFYTNNTPHPISGDNQPEPPSKSVENHRAIRKYTHGNNFHINHTIFHLLVSERPL